MSVKIAFHIIIPLLLIIQLILQSINLYGVSTKLIQGTNANIKVDTTNSTINDIIGGIIIRNVSSSTSTTSSVRPTMIPTTIPDITQDQYDDAKAVLESFNAVLLQIVADNSTFEEFNVARVFNLHDYFILAPSGFMCYSSNTGKDQIASIKKTNNCPANGFIACFGAHNNKTTYQITAYQSINTNYLLTSTSLDESIINDLSTNWTRVKDYYIPKSLSMNISESTYNKISRFLCSSDKKTLSSDGLTQKYMSRPTAFGVASNALLWANIFIFMMPPVMFIIWLVCFSLDIARYFISQNLATKFAKGVQLDTAISVKVNYNFLISLFVLHGFIFITFLIMLLDATEVFSELRKKRSMRDHEIGNEPHFLMGNIHHLSLSSPTTIPEITMVTEATERTEEITDKVVEVGVEDTDPKPDDPPPSYENVPSYDDNGSSGANYSR